MLRAEITSTFMTIRTLLPTMTLEYIKVIIEYYTYTNLSFLSTFALEGGNVGVQEGNTGGGNPMGQRGEEKSQRRRQRIFVQQQQLLMAKKQQQQQLLMKRKQQVLAAKQQQMFAAKRRQQQLQARAALAGRLLALSRKAMMAKSRF